MAKEEVNEAVEKNAESVGQQPSSAKKKASKKRSVEVDSRVSVEELLSLDSEGSVIVFDENNLPDLQDDVIRELSYENTKSYLVAKAKKEASEETSKKSFREKRREQWDKSPFATLSGSARDRKRSKERKARRPRQGWHLTWLVPEDFDSWAEEAGYRIVRMPKDKNETLGKEKGKKVVIGPEDAPELILCEVPQELYEQHIEAVRMKSKRRMAGQNEQFFQAVDHVNERHGIASSKGVKGVEVSEE